MPTLHLLRHAKSSWGEPGLADHDRPLSDRGRRAAAVMAVHIRKAGIAPDLVMCSNARRTVETLAAIRHSLPRTAGVETTPELYEADASSLLDRLRAAPATVATLMLIGHNPGLEVLAGQLAGEAGDPEARQALGRKFPTGALATLEFEGEWRDLAWGAARLTAFVAPRDLD